LTSATPSPPAVEGGGEPADGGDDLVVAAVADGVIHLDLPRCTTARLAVHSHLLATVSLRTAGEGQWFDRKSAKISRASPATG